MDCREQTNLSYNETLLIMYFSDCLVPVSFYGLQQDPTDAATAHYHALHLLRQELQFLSALTIVSLLVYSTSPMSYCSGGGQV